MEVEVVFFDLSRSEQRGRVTNLRRFSANGFMCLDFVVCLATGMLGTLRQHADRLR